MADPMGEAKLGPHRVDFDRRLKLEFHGGEISSDGGLLPYRALDHALGLTEAGGEVLSETRRGSSVFNQFGDLERSALGPGDVHSADGWREVLEPVVDRDRDRKLRRYFRADVAFASPEVYEFLEPEGFLVRDPPSRQSSAAGLHRAPAHATVRPSAQPCAAHLRRLQLPGQ